MVFLWRFTWWRWLIIKAVRLAPPRASMWLFQHSGLAASLEDLARAAGDLDLVQAVRGVSRR